MPALLLALLTLQAPAERTELERLRDSLAAAADSATLLRLEAATIAVAKERRDDPLVHLRLGFIAYRLGEITRAKEHYDAAASEFEWASDLRPDWPYPWYGLGLAELALGEHSVMAIENIRQMLGKDFLSKAARAFARATEADPSFAYAVVDLANTALTQRIRPRLEVALSAVRMAAASPAGRHAQVQLVRGRVEREAGETDSALTAFREFLAVGGDSGVGLLELARTAYLARQPEQGWAAYFTGARASASAEAVALYRADLAWLADSAEMRAFDALDGAAARASWLEEFWTRRDVAQARGAGERQAEHYRRWFHARRSFRLVSRHRHYDITERYRSPQSEFDDRGVIYLRHGEPDRRARLAQVGVEPNESWMYDRTPPAADLVFHFVARDDASDYKLVESLVDVLGFSRAVRATSVLDPGVSELYASRDEFGPLYGRVGRSMRPPGRELAEDRTMGQRSISTGTKSDSYARRFEEPLEVVASDFVVGGTGDGDSAVSGGQTLHVVFAIPAGRLPSATTGEGTRYPLRFRLVVSDAADRPIATLDTLRVFASRERLRAPAYLTGRLALPLSPGHYRYRFLVTSPDESTGDLVIRDSLAVEALDGARFAVSDVVVGREGSGLVWNTVPLNPLQRYPEGSAAELYYEVYGLAAGATYHTVVRLEREGRRGLFGGRRAPVLLEFDAPADGPRTLVRRGIALRDVSPGNYRLTVVISDPASGVSVTRAQRFQVVAR
jgi:GWxTD domain-containing protein